MKIERNLYLKQLIGSRQNGLIKVVAGMRRSGKSYLLFNIFKDYLLSTDVDREHIIEIVFDDISNMGMRNAEAAYYFIKGRIQDDGIYYVLLDEVQLVKGFEELLNSLLHINNLDVYVTGSNSRFLAKDIITEFRGRSYNIYVYPLSFSEFYSAYDGSHQEALDVYYETGGLPGLVNMHEEQERKQYLSDLWKSVYVRDILERHRIKNESEFEELLRVIASAIGSSLNPLKLSNTFQSLKKVNISSATITKYISYMEDAFIIKKAARWDIKGKKHINSLSKYYFSDLGVRNAVVNFAQSERTHLMENLIYNELLVRRYQVNVGQVDLRTTDAENKTIRKRLEVDFIATEGSKNIFIQSAYHIADDDKMNQELRPLLNIKNSYKKVLITGDSSRPWYDDNGILHIGLIPFLLDPQSLDF